MRHEIERVRQLERADFLEHYRHRHPVVVEGAASATPAAVKWTLDYLVAAIGKAEISVVQHTGDPRDPISVVERTMRFGDFTRKFTTPNFGDDLYLFNVTGGNFWANQALDPSPKANPQLAVLAADFAPPAFVRRDEIIYGQLVLGTSSNGTTLHYDWGGEAKILVQLRGRKHVILFAPDQVHSLYLHRMFDTGTSWPGLSRVDVRRPDLESFPALAGAVGWETVLAPGDVLYWPSFWLHDVVNLDPFTLAINAPLDELPVSALATRQLLGATVATLLDDAGDAERERRLATWMPLLRALEDKLLSPSVAQRSSLWSWVFKLEQLRRNDP